MAKAMEFDFRGSTPAAGRSRDRIPVGRYLLKITKVNTKNTTNDGKPMPTVSFTVQNPPKVEGVTTRGKKLQDNFPLPEDASDSKFGLQKLHALLVAVGFTVDTKKKQAIDLERVLTNKTCWVEVSDNTYTTTKGQEVTNSQIDEYLAPNAAKASSDDDDDEDEDDDEDDDDLEEEDEDDDEEDEDDDDEDDEDSDDDDDEDDEEDEEEDDEDEDEEDDDEDEDEDEDEEPAPRSRSRRAAPAASKPKRAAKPAAKPAAAPARRSRKSPSARNFPI